MSGKVVGNSAGVFGVYEVYKTVTSAPTAVTAILVALVTAFLPVLENLPETLKELLPTGIGGQVVLALLTAAVPYIVTAVKQWLSDNTKAEE
jgi:hypothetical protein